MNHSRQFLRLGGIAVAGIVLAAFAVTAAPPTQAYQNSQLCIINNSSKTVLATFITRDQKRPGIIRGNKEDCQMSSRAGGPDVYASVDIGDRVTYRNGRPIVENGRWLGTYFVNNPAVGWPVIAARVQSHPSCSWDTYTDTCWYARLGQRQHRCIQENGYWLRPSREADSNGAKQFRVQVYDGTADPSTFGC